MAQCRWCGESSDGGHCPNCGKPSNEDPATRVGATIGNHMLGRMLGEGPVGAVYEAVHIASGEKVRLKIIDSALLQAEPELAEAVTQLVLGSTGLHEGLPELVEMALENPDGPSLSTRWVDGKTLRELLSESPPDPVESVRIVTGLLGALEALHDDGLAHLDVKPENVLVVESGDPAPVCLLDVGSSIVGSRARTGAHYRSPEQARGSDLVGAATDIYGAGVILYETLSGQRPFASNDFDVLMSRISVRRPTPLSELRPDLPSGLTKVVDRAMATDLEERFQSAREMIAALEAISQPGLAAISSVPGLATAPSGGGLAAAQSGGGLAAAPSGSGLVAAQSGSGLAAAPSGPALPTPPEGLGIASAPTGPRLPRAPSGGGLVAPPSAPGGGAAPQQPPVTPPAAAPLSSPAGPGPGSGPIATPTAPVGPLEPPSEAEGPKPINKVAAAFFVGIAIAAGGAMLWYTVWAAREREAPISADEQVEAPLPEKTATKRQGTINVELRGAPRGAVFFVDGRRLTANPFRAPRDPHVHQIRIEARGYDPFETTLTFTDDRVVDVEMTQLETSPELGNFRAHEKGPGASDRRRRKGPLKLRKFQRDSEEEAPDPAALRDRETVHPR